MLRDESTMRLEAVQQQLHHGAAEELDEEVRLRYLRCLRQRQ